MVGNQVILWATVIGPLLSLFFMKNEVIKRYLPAGLLAAFLSIIVCDTGVGRGWWAFRETTYPLGLLSSYVYGLFPIVPIWILSYTYKRFWLFCGVEAIANTIFAFYVLPWFASRGIVDFDAGVTVFIAETLISVITYGFQMWQEASVKERYES